MKENRINALISIAAVIAAIVMAGSLSYAIGKWSFGGSHYDFTIKFPNATGISANSAVKYAGATIGRVKSVDLIPRKEQTADPRTKAINCVAVVCEVNSVAEIDRDCTVVIKQDGIGISAKYVLLTPPQTPSDVLVAGGDTMQGNMPYDLGDLIQPAGEALTQAKSLVNQMQPIMDRFDKLSQKLGSDLPPLINHADKFLLDGDTVLADLATPENKEHLSEMLANLRVATDNLKVVSSNAKALTATLADKPWRVFWGGSTVPAPAESAVLKSNKVILLKPDVEVSGAGKK